MHVGALSPSRISVTAFCVSSLFSQDSYLGINSVCFALFSVFLLASRADPKVLSEDLLDKFEFVLGWCLS